MKQSFSLQEKSLWTINGVRYRDITTSVDLSQKLLPSMTQDKLAKYTKENKDNFHGASFPFYHVLFTTLYNHKENKEYKKGVEEVRYFINESMLNHYLNTLTRLKYNSSGKDLIIHDYKQPNQKIVKLDSMVGEDGSITEIKNIENLLKVLLGTKQSVEEINSVYNWLTGSNAYLFRINETPDQSLETVSGFSASSNRAYLGCYRNPTDSDSGLGSRGASCKIF